MLQQNRQFGFLQDENQLCWKFSSTQIKWLLNIYVQHIHSLPKGRLHYPIRLAFWVDAEYTAFVWNTKVSLQLHLIHSFSTSVLFFAYGESIRPWKTHIGGRPLGKIYLTSLKFSHKWRNTCPAAQIMRACSYIYATPKYASPVWIS